jgi:hypothetical protein
MGVQSLRPEADGNGEHEIEEEIEPLVGFVVLEIRATRSRW